MRTGFFLLHLAQSQTVLISTLINICGMNEPTLPCIEHSRSSNNIVSFIVSLEWDAVVCSLKVIEHVDYVSVCLALQSPLQTFHSVLTAALRSSHGIPFYRWGHTSERLRLLAKDGRNKPQLWQVTPVPCNTKECAFFMWDEGPQRAGMEGRSPFSWE